MRIAGVSRWRKRLTVMLCPAGTLLAGAAILSPVNMIVFRVALIGGLLGFYLGLVIVCWRKWRPVGYGLLLLGVVGIALPFLPGERPDVWRVRTDYVAALRSFQGCRYVWGGEGRLGIDCSGLPRRAWRNALVREYVRTWNGALIRDALENWWFDASARALSRGYRGYTMPLDARGKIRTMSYAHLTPGDLAATDSGVHTLTFLGGQEWIQADSEPGRVIVLNGRTGDCH